MEKDTIDRLEDKIDKVHDTIHLLMENHRQLVTNQSLMQQEIAALSKAIQKIEDIDKKFLVCQGDCMGRSKLLEKDGVEVRRDIEELYGKIRFRDKVLIGITVTLFIRIFIYLVLGVKA